MTLAAEERIRAAVAELGDAILAALADTGPRDDVPDKLMSVSLASQALGVSRATLYSGPLRDGSLQSLTIGRRRLIPASAVAAFQARSAGNGND